MVPWQARRRALVRAIRWPPLLRECHAQSPAGTLGQLIHMHGRRPMPTRTIWLTAMLSAGMAFALGLLLAVVLSHALPVQAQGVTTSTSTAPPVVPAVRAERFELVDQTGAILASLGKHEDGSVGL